MSDPTEGWAESAAERLARNHSVPGALTPLTIRRVKEITLPLLRQLEADEAALSGHFTGGGWDRSRWDGMERRDVMLQDTPRLPSRPSGRLKRSLGVE